jgi:type II secretory pathway component PulM
MDEVKTMPPQRALVINTLLSILASCAVFVILAWLVLVPQMARQEAEIRELRANLVALQSALDEAMKEPEAAPAPAPQAAPGATAAAPAAPAPAGAPAAAMAAPAAPSAPAAAAPAPAK